MDRAQAAIEAAKGSTYPLLAATLVAVMAFYPIYGSEAGAGEYCQNLFTVFSAALILSWVVAMMITTVQCVDLLPELKPYLFMRVQIASRTLLSYNDNKNKN